MRDEFERVAELPGSQRAIFAMRRGVSDPGNLMRVNLEAVVGRLGVVKQAGDSSGAVQRAWRLVAYELT